MEPNMNNSNNNNTRVRPVRAPGFANRDAGDGDTADGGNASAGAAPVNGGNDAVFQDRPKKSHGMLYSMILLAILAAGGIGFGVWAMLDGNSRAQKKDEQISQLQSQLAEKSGVVVDDGGNVSSLENPVIKATPPAQFELRHSISVVSTGSPNEATMTFSAVDGGNLTCRYPNAIETGGCTISGVPDGIYKIMTIRQGNGIGSEKIGFLMKDGTVWFAPIYNNGDVNAGVNTNLQAKRINIDGFIKDVVEVAYASDINEITAGSGFSTVFVMSDNSLIKYDDSLFSE